MQEAGIMNLLRTLLIILIVYYAFRFLARLFAPYLMKKAMEQMQQKAQQHHRSSTSNDVKEGETIIDKKPNTHQQSKDSVGEYVDFEEID